MPDEIKSTVAPVTEPVKDTRSLRIQTLNKVEDGYKDNEKALIDKMMKDVGIEPKPETPEETPTTDKETDAKPVEGEGDTKEDKEVKFLLSELIGLDKEVEVKEPDKDTQEEGEPLTDEQIELAKYKKKEVIEQASDKIEELLGNYSEQEAEVLREHMVKLLEKGMYNKLSESMTVEEKTAHILVMAKGLATDKLKVVAKEEAEAQSVLESATVTPQAKQRETETADKERDRLREASRNGDRRATVLLHRSDPVIDRLVANAKKT